MIFSKIISESDLTIQLYNTILYLA